MPGQPNSWSDIPQFTRDRLRAFVFARDKYHCRLRLPGICVHRDGCRRCAAELDHIVPRSRGGAVMDPTNCRAACGPCNRSRGAGPKPAWRPRPAREEW